MNVFLQLIYAYNVSFAILQGHFLHVDNSHRYGFLVISENVESSKVHPEMYEIFNNKEVSFWILLVLNFF